ncbi:ATP-binding protein [Ectobacillus panaciterrae]|uniref:ATP-binding protein n=1 Tax=Ectobacillus panaciterrae TaxID=363872 RepID=UPI00138AB29B|nr:ATP-binding protein [Ectobacillus panaciterrae]
MPEKYVKAVIVITAGISIVLCMLSPIDVIENCIHDMRQIPFVLGILYGGWPVGIILLGILITFRILIYGYTFISVIVYITMFFLALFFIRPYAQMKKRKRILFSALIYILLATVAAIQAKLINNFQITFGYVINFILFPSVGTMLITFVVETLRDHISLSNKMIKLEKMEVVSQLAAGISHEIRNPLTVVKGFLQLFRTDGLSNEKKEMYVGHALIELDRAEAIISDYLTFAKPSSENIVNIDVKQELLRIIDIVHPLSNGSPITIYKNLEPCEVKGNVQNLQQVFLNIIKNGIESMSGGGTLKIQTRRERKTVIITIQDTGCGMTNEQILRLGEPYFSTKEKGTGLGMMVSYRIIESMKGTIEVKSHIGKGTAFYIKLPSV